jgi:ketosteroid isomerase-like protein
MTTTGTHPAHADLKATVAEIYAAFGRGDIPAILDALAEDVAWEHWPAPAANQAPVPWLLPRTGKAGAQEFFQVVSSWTISDFQVLDLMVGERQVSAQIVIEARLPNGATLHDEEMHLWTFDETGKVSRFRHYVDTAKHIAAAQAG